MSFRTGGPGGGNSGYLRSTADCPDYNSAYSVAFWIYFEDGIEVTEYFLQVEYAWNESDKFRTDTSDSTKLSFQCYDSTNTARYATTATGVISADTWHHIAMVRSSATSIKLYVDGVEEAELTDDMGTRTASADFRVGCASASTSTTYDRLIADIKAWDVALTATEVAAESLASTPADYTNCTNFAPCRRYSPVDAGGKPDDLVGTWAFEATGPEVFEDDPPDVPYWRGFGTAPDLGPFQAEADTADPQSVTPTTLALVLTTYAPTVTGVAPQSVTPTPRELTITTYAPTVTVSEGVEVVPTTVALVATTYEPTVTASDHQEVVPTTAALVVTTYEPTVTAGSNIEVVPTTAALVVTTYEPTVTSGDNQEVVPTTAALVVTTYEPTVTAGDNQEVVPTPAALVVTTYPPTVTTPDPQEVVPTTAALVITTYEPTVTATVGNITATPEPATLTLTTFPPRTSIPSPHFSTSRTGLAVQHLSNNRLQVTDRDMQRQINTIVRHVNRLTTLPRSTALGSVMYYGPTGWVLVEPGADGSTLTVVDGVPKWV